MKRKPRTLVRPDGWEGRTGWELLTTGNPVWVSRCVMKGCTNKTHFPVCGSCMVPEFGVVLISPQWRSWFWRNPTRERMMKLLEEHFEEGEFEVST